jgi:ABC-type multidrug transport system fused ATPase/permease subunit
MAWQNMPDLERKNNGEHEGAARLLGVFRYSGRALRLVWSTNRGLTAALALFTLMAGTLPAGAAYVGKLVVDGVIRASASGQGGDRDQVLMWVGLEGLLILMIAMAQRGLTTCQSLLRAVLGHRISTLILEKALTLHLTQFEDPDIHDKMNQARREAISRPVALVNGTFALIKDAIALIAYVGLLFQFSGWAVLLVAAAGLPAFVVEARLSGHAFRFLTNKTPEMRERTYLEMVVTREDFAKEILVFRLGKMLIGRYNELFWKLYAQDRRLQLQRGLWGFVLGSVSILALYGAYLWIILTAIRGEMTIGEMTMYLVLFRQSQSSVTSALTNVGGMYEHNLYISTLYAFLELDVSGHRGRATSGLRPEEGVRFEKVTFTYPDSTRPALREVSFTIEPGRLVALVGSNGSGKTTLVKLLARLYEPDSGRILLHGRDITEWDIDALRAKIAVIFQDFVRFKFTVGENIGVGDAEHFDDRQRWAEAAEMGLVAEDIERLGKGYDTRLGKSFKGGTDLSGGQWQKMALARLFMRQEAEILILDEPTASVDAEAEAQIFEHVRQCTPNRMCLLISHRLSFPRTADEILVLDDGVIIERGSHQELIGLGRRYAELFQLQASGYRD